MKNEIERIYRNLCFSIKSLNDKINQFIKYEYRDTDPDSIKKHIHRVRSELWELETLLNNYKEDKNV